MKWTLLLLCAACSPKGPATPVAEVPHLVATSDLRWYRVDAQCAQGPFELELDATGATYGEIAELDLHTTHAVSIEAAVLVDGKEVERTHGVFADGGQVAGGPANTRCLASDRDKLVHAQAGGADGGGGIAVTPGSAPVPPRSTIAPPLLPIRDLVPLSSSIVTFHVPRSGKITIRFWSIEPNDLTGVAFGLAHVVMHPNIGDVAYEAYLAQEQARMRVPPPRVVVAQQASAGRRAEQERIARDRQAAIDAALADERARRHKLYCDARHDDRDCWGPGGFAGFHELELRQRERERYCAANVEDARCWTADQWQQRRQVWSERVRIASLPPPKPSGPPPAPLDDPPAPQPSLHAEWRPGYWNWDEGQWVWLAGQWNVPDADIAQEQTATAPQPPPPPQPETPPPPPVRAVVWIPGYWMWNRTQWVWIAGSYQLAQTGRIYAPPQWRSRGSVHVFVPGGWLSR